MKIDVLLGLQWGDEGKGKIVDVLAPMYDVIARFQGGPNAGHTLEFNQTKHVLHTIPSGVFHKEKINIIGNGVVIDLYTLQREAENLIAKGVDITNNLLISAKAHCILPSHRLLDAALEKHKGNAKIGSTLKGIGPAYTDKTGRNGIRVGDVFTQEFFAKYENLKKQHFKLAEFYGFNVNSYTIDELKFDEYEANWLKAVEFIKKFRIINSEYYINKLIQEDKSIIAEGAQGALLDVDFGSYPFVTSSNTVTAGACTGLGVAPSRIGQVYGVFKAYCTRVGSGPFPTELLDETGVQIRDKGREFGSTTGRPRRCGWLDLVMLKYSCMINGVTRLIMTKADVLSGFASIKVCTHYHYKGSEITEIPFDLDVQEIKPVYKEIQGWREDISKITQLELLPNNILSYVNFIEQYLSIPVYILSVGPDRSQLLFKH